LDTDHYVQKRSIALVDCLLSPRALAFAHLVVRIDIACTFQEKPDMRDLQLGLDGYDIACMTFSARIVHPQQKRQPPNTLRIGNSAVLSPAIRRNQAPELRSRQKWRISEAFPGRR
jgi:hypothetical protein